MDSRAFDLERRIGQALVIAILLLGSAVWLLPTFFDDPAAAREVIVIVIVGIAALGFALSAVFTLVVEAEVLSYLRRSRELDEKWSTASDALADAELRYGDRVDRPSRPSPHVPLTKLQMVGVDLREAALVGADLDDSDMSEANLQRADLTGAKLRRVNLKGANLRGCDLRLAGLSRSYLAGASLRDARLDGADLTGVDLSGANIDGATFADALYDETTIWPSRVSPRQLGAIEIDEER